MKAVFWQRGESIDYKNDTQETIPANTVVAIKTRIGVAGGEILPGQTGSLHVCGIFELPKTSKNDIEIGTLVYSDGNGITESAETAAASEGTGKEGGGKTANIPAGYVVEKAAAADTVVKVKLLG
ncbi:MAG: DUF2190 family protein [Roseburia sp.]